MLGNLDTAEEAVSLSDVCSMYMTCERTHPDTYALRSIKYVIPWGKQKLQP